MMRRLFLPACFCFMTLSCSTGAGAGVSLEQISGSNLDETKVETSTTDSSPGHGSHGDRDVAADGGSNVTEEDLSIETQEIVPTPQPRPSRGNRAVQPFKPTAHSRPEICKAVVDAAESNDLPIPFFIRLLFQESRFRPDAVSPAGAQGIAQFMPATAADVGLQNPFDPLQAVAASARLLRDLVRQFGNFGLAAAAYNAGPKRIQDWIAKKEKLPRETRHYVKTITGVPAEKWTEPAPGNPMHTLPEQVPCQYAAGAIAMDNPHPSGDLRAAPQSVGPSEKPASKHSVASATPRRSIRRAPRTPKAQVARTKDNGAIQLAASRKKKRSKKRVSER
ncbi:MAG TPA: lytic transglycosylase domain-containing protein [Pseudolabrys sp.]|nr:lytic transglycosylase domain-containing protein [Pseudolabrys sp.]